MPIVEVITPELHSLEFVKTADGDNFDALKAEVESLGGKAYIINEDRTAVDVEVFGLKYRLELGMVLVVDGKYHAIPMDYDTFVSRYRYVDDKYEALAARVDALEKLEKAPEAKPKTTRAEPAEAQ